MHLVQHGVPQKVLQAILGHKKAASTEWYALVLALGVTRKLGVRFSVDADDARLLLAGAGTGHLLQGKQGQ